MDGIKNIPCPPSPSPALDFYRRVWGERKQGCRLKQKMSWDLDVARKKRRGRREGWSKMFLSIKDLSAGLYLNGIAAESPGSPFLVIFWPDLSWRKFYRAAVKIGYKKRERQIDIDGSYVEGKREAKSKKFINLQMNVKKIKTNRKKNCHPIAGEFRKLRMKS